MATTDAKRAIAAAASILLAGWAGTPGDDHGLLPGDEIVLEGTLEIRKAAVDHQ